MRAYLVGFSIKPIPDGAVLSYCDMGCSFLYSVAYRSVWYERHEMIVQQGCAKSAQKMNDKAHIFTHRFKNTFDGCNR